MKTKFSKKAYASSSTMWGKLKKYAHDVWDMSAQGEQIQALRKRQDTARASEDQEDKRDEGEAIPLGDMFGPGELVLLFLGGRKLQARVLDSHDGGLSLISDEGYLDNIPQEWVKRADPAPAPSQEQVDRSRKPTREDIPVQQAPGAPVSNAVNDLQKMLESRGGHIAVQLDPTGSSVLELKQSGQGIQATLWHTATTVAHRGQYASVADLAQQLAINGFEKEVPVQSLKPR